MKIINHKLYLGFHECVSIGIKADALKKAKLRNSSSWSFIDDPSDKRKVLIEYDNMRDKYKDLVIEELCGGLDPYQFMSAELLKPLLTNTPEDVTFIREHKVNDRYLDDAYQQTCLISLQFLNMLSNIKVRDMKAIGFKNSAVFHEAVFALIKSEKVQLPTTYNRLKIKVRDYKKKGAKLVINSNIGNQNGRKINKDGIALIEELIGKHNNMNNVQIAMIYNAAGMEAGWEPITPKSIFRYRNELETEGSRKGVGVWRDKHDMVVERKRPSRPNYLWVGDGTPYELYFQFSQENKDGHQVRKYHGRKVVYVVVDAFNDMIVGVSIGETENSELALKAWKNACFNTGAMPYEVKVDNFARTLLHPVYQKLSAKPEFFAPSAVGNARDKVIEAFFGRLYGQITRIHENASGRNITAKEQPNRDFLNKIKKNFPTEDGVTQQIANDMVLWNGIARKSKGGISLEQEWRDADHSQDRAFTDFHRLEIFGQEHSHTNRLTNKGVEVTIGGLTRKYMKMDIDFYQSIGTSYQVKFDKDDYSKIMVVSEDNQKHVLEEKQAIPMAKMDMQEGDRKALNVQLDFKKQIMNMVIDKQKDRRKIIEEAGLMDSVSAEGIAKALFIENGQQKGLNYASQDVLKSLSSDVLNKGRNKKDMQAIPQLPQEETDEGMFSDPYSK
jgi:hypothetical protein